MKGIRVELRQLEVFLAVADELHFTHAAARLGLAQSAVSSSVRALEADLGAPLLHRTTQRVALTDVGAAFLEPARRTVAAAAAARAAADDVRGVRRGVLRWGILQTRHGPVDVPALLSGFRHDHPDVDVVLRQAPTRQLRAAVRDGELDLAFVIATEPAGDGVELLSLGREPLVLLVARDHPLANRDDVDVAALQGLPFVDFVPGWGSRILLDRMLARAGVTRQTVVEVDDVPTALSLVRAGLGVAVTAAERAERADPDLRIVPLRPTVFSELAVAVPAGGPATFAAREFLGRVPVVSDPAS